jgi:hypothetical protein
MREAASSSVVVGLPDPCWGEEPTGHPHCGLLVPLSLPATYASPCGYLFPGSLTASPWLHNPQKEKRGTHMHAHGCTCLMSMAKTFEILLNNE